MEDGGCVRGVRGCWPLVDEVQDAHVRTGWSFVVGGLRLAIEESASDCTWNFDTDVSAVDQPKHPRKAREACVMLRRKRARGRMAASASAHAETRRAAAAAHLQQLAVRRPLDVVTEE